MATVIAVLIGLAATYLLIVVCWARCSVGLSRRRLERGIGHGECSRQERALRRAAWDCAGAASGALILGVLGANLLGTPGFIVGGLIGGATGVYCARLPAFRRRP